MTPLTEAVEAYLAKGLARFHMPGHKGRAAGLFDQVSEYDVTEVMGTDSLYECKEAIRETERQYAALYESGDCLLSAGGSTLCIQAMLATVLRPGEEFLIGRNCHSSAVNAAALCGFEPVWLMKQTPEALEHALSEHPGVKAAYLTSPDYFGSLADIAACSKICHEHGALLLVDNAHGAHLPFFEKNLHPMHLGADLCADSLHKTLPVLTGGALLHLADPSLYEAAKRRMRLFGSTSPNYLIMLSADGCLDYLGTKARFDFPALAARMETLRALAAENGLAPLTGDVEPARLALSVSAVGLTAEQFGARLREFGIEPEYVNPERAVLMASPFNTEEDFCRLETFLRSTPGSKTPAEEFLPDFAPKQKIPMREAVFAASEEIPTEEAEGRVAASLSIPCPPCIALTVPGETVGAETVRLLLHYGVRHIPVIR
ncbi:MAG TPA: aminotransferase class I/II-fold pyridoxal phosphate-dependent enzyme [Oscillospiraceae bacterium]|nr:aminotransferase class I/II-fold pyridoxal phosphate-dependent enzyme [Oscillospiraceae bacterium]